MKKGKDEIQRKKVYNLCEIKQKQFNDEEIGNLMTELIIQNQEKDQLLTQKQKQIQQLEFMIQSLQLGIQKRDDIIQEIRQENIELKDQNLELRNRAAHQSSFAGTSNSPTNKRINLMESQSLESPTKFDYNTQKKLKRARTKENNFDESLQKILENEYENMNYYIQDYYQLQHLITIKTLIQSEENFVQTIQKLDFVGIVNIFDAISLILQEHKSLFQNVIKLRRLFECSLELEESYKFDEKIQQICYIISDTLNCDKAQIFILDQEKEELWTKNYKNDQIVVYNINEDITGLCLLKKQNINVHNAYNDLRFNKENDRKFNYKTNTLILSPIMDKANQDAIGVIQATNILNLNGHFNNDHVFFLTNMAKVISVLLRAQQQKDESITIQNSLRSLININFQINSLQDRVQLLLAAENHLKQLFHVQKGKIFIIEGEKYVRYDENKQLEEYDKGIGLIGEADRINEFISVGNAYNHPNFNSKVDIETSMPVYVIAVKDTSLPVLLEVVNRKGIRSIDQTKANPLDQEILLTFGKIISAKLKGIPKVQQ